MKLRKLKLICSFKELDALPEGKVLINTIGVHSYNVAQRDALFAEALQEGGALVPDDMSIVNACHWLNADSLPEENIANYDLFIHEMSKVNSSATPQHRPVVFFLGAMPSTLALIGRRCSIDFPNVEVKSFSPPFVKNFDEASTNKMIEAINNAKPDLLWIGMPTPVQEKWIYANWDRLDIHCHVGTIDGVFELYADTVDRAPLKWRQRGWDGLYQIIRHPRRLFYRGVIDKVLFFCRMMVEKIV